MNIAVFASHGDSDLQAIIDACKTNKIPVRVRSVISNNLDSTALLRASKEHIDGYYVSSKNIINSNELNLRLIDILNDHSIDMIFLAGYQQKLGIPILKKYENRIFNIHPALLPQYGGKGMYGLNVHKAVIEAKEVETGVTVHRVNEEYDSDEIVAQTKLPVFEADTPEILAARVLEREHTFIVEVINDIIIGNIKLGL